MAQYAGFAQTVFHINEHPQKLFARAKTELLSVDGPVRICQTELGRHSGGFPVMQVAQQDGYDVVTGQQIWGLFNPTRNRYVSAWEFDLFEARSVVAMFMDHDTGWWQSPTGCLVLA